MASVRIDAVARLSRIARPARIARSCWIARRSWSARFAPMVALAMACSADPSPDRDAEQSAHLPEVWRQAAIDPENGGRYLPEARAALRRFQATIGDAIPYPHYAGPGTVVVGIKLEFVASRIRARIEQLLANEGPDSELRILALTDAPVTAVAAALGPVASDPRLSLVRAEWQSAPATFPFVRDYAPFVRASRVGDGYETVGLVLYGGSTLNKVVDRGLAVHRYRNLAGLRSRLALSRRVLDLYAARIPRKVSVHELSTALDGGNLLSDGRGSCFLTRVVLDKNAGDADRVRRDLRDGAGCARTWFLDAPERLDDVQHVDTLLFFADAENAVLSMPVLYESDLARDAANTRTLLELGYTLHRLPRRTASLSYANILVTRRNAYVPQYTAYLVESERQNQRNRRIASLDRSRDRERLIALLREPVETRRVSNDPALAADNQRALDVIERLMPDRRIVGVDSDETLGSLGSWHCLTHELPEALPGTFPVGEAAQSRGL